MNRQIKFRAWHNRLKKMLYPPGESDSMTLCRDSKNRWVSFRTRGSSEADEPQFLSAHMSWDGRWYMQGEIQDVEWMQFIGLKDKNGREIFEGDLLKTFYFISESPSEEYGISEIKWGKTGWIYNFEREISDYFLKNSEVVGNIFENPEWK